MDSFPSNSRRAVNPPSDEVKEVRRVTTGEVVRRKPPLGRRMTQSLVGGNAENVWGYVFGELLIPAARDMIADAGKGLLDGMIYGEASPRNSRRPRNGGPVSYNTRYSTPTRRDDRREISRRGRASHSFDEIILESRAEAQEVLRSLDDMIARYDGATVAHLYELVGVSSNFTDQKWGWLDLHDARVRRVNGGYLLDLPRPEPID